MRAAGALSAPLTVLLSAWAWRCGTRWWVAGRALDRLGTVRRSPAPGPAFVQRALRSAGVDVDARLALDLWIAAALLSVLVTSVTGASPLAVAMAVLGPPVALGAMRGRAARIRRRQLPLALDAIAAALRGGASLRTAVGDAASIGGPLGDELRRAAAHAAAGRPLAETLAEWSDADSDPHVRLAAAALVVAAGIGGPGADAVDAAAASLRERADAEQEVAALSVQARLSALLLTLAPIAFAFLLSTLDPTSARFLFGTPAGWACIAGGTALDVLGGWWMSRLVRRTR